MRPPPLFEIREYCPADFPALCSIDRACFSDEIAYTPEEIALGLVQRGAFAFVAEHEGIVVGFVLASQARRRTGHIITIDVVADFRRSGVGGGLMACAEQQLRDKGAERIVLEVSTANASAIRFYRRFGYTMKRLLPGYYPDGSDAHLMEKELARVNESHAG